MVLTGAGPGEECQLWLFAVLLQAPQIPHVHLASKPKLGGGWWSLRSGCFLGLAVVLPPHRGQLLPSQCWQEPRALIEPLWRFSVFRSVGEVSWPPAQLTALSPGAIYHDQTRCCSIFAGGVADRMFSAYTAGVTMRPHLPTASEGHPHSCQKLQ